MQPLKLSPVVGDHLQAVCHERGKASILLGSPGEVCTMGDETKETELEHGNYDPLHATRKPSTAERVEEKTPQGAEMPEQPGDSTPRSE
jgi:hypothetical protein